VCGNQLPSAHQEILNKLVHPSVASVTAWRCLGYQRASGYPHVIKEGATILLLISCTGVFPQVSSLFYAMTSPRFQHFMTHTMTLLHFFYNLYPEIRFH
jgi:hypothetical protein